MFIELTFPDKSILGNTNKLLVGCIYRHPRPNTGQFTAELYNKLDTYNNRTKIPVLLMGDINIDMCKTNSSSTRYAETLANLGYQNLIDVIYRSEKI